MKLTSLKEFYEKSDSKDITLYQEYLASAKKDISEGMEEAKKILGENDSIIMQLRENISSIESLETIIENSIRELISNSIAKMSDDELKGIIDNYVEDLQGKKEKLSDELGELRENVSAKVQEYTNKMEQLGYKYSYYEKEDVGNFFEDIKSAEEYIMGLVKSNLDKEALKATFLWLYSIDSVQEEFANAILSLRKIAKICDDSVLKRAIQTFLTPEKIGKVIGIESQEQCLSVFESLQKVLKTRTEFFECLPEPLKEDIKNNGVVDNGTYNRLKAIYLMYKESGEIVTPANTDVQKSEQEIDEFAKKIATLDSKIERAQAACETRGAMIDLVESFVVVESNEDLSYKAVSTEALEQIAKEQRIKNQIDELNKQLGGLEQIGYKLGDLLNREILKRGFRVLEAKRECQKMENGNSIYCDTEVETIADAEKRRLSQFRLLGQAISDLNNTREELEEVNKSRNIYRNLTGANQRKRESLLEEYNKIINDTYAALDGENLLRINISRNYIDIEDETRFKPRNFEDFLEHPNLVVHIINDTLFEEMTNRGLFKHYTTQEGLNHTNEILYELAKKLFGFSKKLDGTYEFEISLEEIDRLVALQEEFVSLYESVRFMRDAEKNSFQRYAELELDKNFKQLISDIKMDLATVTQEDVENYQKEVEAKIDEIKDELSELRVSARKDGNNCSQYEMLNGLDDTCMSSVEVRKSIQFK